MTAAAPQTFHKKPVEISAMHWDGSEDSQMAIIAWVRRNGGTAFADDLSNILISTLEGEMAAIRDDWIIQGVKGEFYPCKPDIFEATYEQSEGEGLRQREGDQPLPNKNEFPAMQNLVIEDIEKRKQIGLQRYGTLLQPFNGRDMLRDVYEELLDAAIYIRGLIFEREAGAVEVKGDLGEFEQAWGGRHLGIIGDKPKRVVTEAPSHHPFNPETCPACWDLAGTLHYDRPAERPPE